jgi:hypothetical protein
MAPVSREVAARHITFSHACAGGPHASNVATGTTWARDRATLRHMPAKPREAMIGRLRTGRGSHVTHRSTSPVLAA